MMNLSTGTNVTVKYRKDNAMLCKGTIAISKPDSILIKCDPISKNFDYIKDVTVLVDNQKGGFEAFDGIVSNYDDEAVEISDLKLLTSIERRRDERAPSVIHSDAAIGEAKNISATILNISASGVLFSTKTELNINDKVKLNFPVLTSDGFDIFHGEGEIVRNAGNSFNSHQYGIRFTDIKEEDTSKIQQYITKLLGKKNPEQLNLRIRGRRG